MIKTMSQNEQDKEAEVPHKDIVKSPKTSPQDTVYERDILECPEDLVGSKIARDFGKSGIYLGEVLRIEYDSEDDNKVLLYVKYIPNHTLTSIIS